MIKLSDLAFDCLRTYWYYQSMNKSHVLLPEESNKVSEPGNTFQATFHTTKFSGDYPIMVFDFLTRCVEETDTLWYPKPTYS